MQKEPGTDTLRLGLCLEGWTEADAEAPPAAVRPSAAPASVILVSHPQRQRLGSRFSLSPGATLEIGRVSSTDLSLPEVPSVSRRHAVLRHDRKGVVIEDLGSTNGTYVNDRRVRDRSRLRNGDRFQLGDVHFKFLQERDVEHAYYSAVYHLVMCDGLTEVFNRRKFVEEIDREIARAARHRRPLAAILVDVDRFQAVNDSYGRLCGDFVLKRLGRMIQRRIRSEQVLARVGGDVFGVLCPETDTQGAAVLADHLRVAVAGQAFRCGSATVEVTCSFGVAELEAKMPTRRRLLSRAERALRLAKEDGRDRVAIFEEPPS